MGKKISDLINPSETLNSVLDECTDSVKSKLIPLNVKQLEGSRLLMHYNVDAVCTDF